MTEDELEQERHRCEVRALIRVAREDGRGKVRAYLDHKAVKSRAPRLRADLNAQIERGNNGEHGVWL